MREVLLYPLSLKNGGKPTLNDHIRLFLHKLDGLACHLEVGIDIALVPTTSRNECLSAQLYKNFKLKCT